MLRLKPIQQIRLHNAWVRTKLHIRLVFGNANMMFKLGAFSLLLMLFVSQVGIAIENHGFKKPVSIYDIHQPNSKD